MKKYCDYCHFLQVVLSKIHLEAAQQQNDLVFISSDMHREFWQIIMIGSANPSLQLKTHFSVLGPEMGLSASEVKNTPGPKATFSSVVWSHGPEVL